VHDRESLKFGTRIEGPALIVEDDTTTVIPRGFVARVTRHAHLLMERRNGGAR
jgi:N-methylhydantoinase A/oxoprolinase/acetone carboxylase beta subunit